MARATSYNISESFDYEIRGFHVYKSKWAPVLHQQLYTTKEKNNPYDHCAIAVTTEDLTTQSIDCLEFRQDELGVVGHIPVELSHILRPYIDNRTIAITCKVLDNKYQRSNKAEGLVIPARYTLNGHLVAVNSAIASVSREIQRVRDLDLQLSNLSLQQKTFTHWRQLGL